MISMINLIVPLLNREEGFFADLFSKTLNIVGNRMKYGMLHFSEIM